MAPAWDSKGCPYLGSPLRIVHLLCATRTAQRAVGALPIHTSAVKHAPQRPSAPARAKRGVRSHLPRPSPCRNVRPDPRRSVSLGMAREKAQECRRLLVRGIEPIAAHDADRTSQTLSVARLNTCERCAAAYIDFIAAVEKVPSMRRSGTRRSLRMPRRCLKRCW